MLYDNHRCPKKMVTPKELDLGPGDIVLIKSEHTKAVKKNKQKLPVVAKYLGEYEVINVSESGVTLKFVAGRGEEDPKKRNEVTIPMGADVIYKKTSD